MPPPAATPKGTPRGELLAKRRRPTTLSLVCGRFVQSDPSRIALEFGIAAEPPGLIATPRYNIAPTQEVGVVRILEAAKGRQIDLLRWGLVPSGARDPSVGNRMINARVETLEERPAFRDALRRRRCLVIADGFYEWKREGRAKQPYFVRRVDGNLTALAGLWGRWLSADGEVLDTFTLVTKPSEAPIAEIHDRMPAVLGESAHDAWLAPDESDPAPLVELLLAQSPALVAVPVSTRVNKPANDDAGLIEPIDVPRGLFD